MDEVQQNLVSVVASLLVLGRPSTPEVLQKSSSKPIGSLPDIGVLCNLKDSPILLQDDGLVNFSKFAVNYFSQVISTYSRLSIIPHSTPDLVNTSFDVRVHPNDVACSTQAAQSFSLSRKRNLQNGSESSLDWKISRKQKVNQSRRPILQERIKKCNQDENLCMNVLENLNSTKDLQVGKVEDKKRRGGADISLDESMLVAEQLPGFQKYLVEAKEGSGGYGIVYRVLRKSDSKFFAIKCPLEKTCKKFVTNEIEMLKKLGGKNFVARLEDVIQEGNQDCIVLDYIEHDKPEELKREISLMELQWYGYCLFRALAYMHQEGVIHRDVKPGNFLFSRERKTGFLVDFNLAVDIHKSQGRSRKAPCNDQKFRLPSSNSNLGSTKIMPSVLKNAALKPEVFAEEQALPLPPVTECLKQTRFQGEGFGLTNPNKIGNSVFKTEGSFSGADLENCADNLAGTASLPKVNLLSPSALDKSNWTVCSPHQSPMLRVSATGQGAQNQHGGLLILNDLQKEPLPRTGRRELIDYVVKTVNSPQNNQTPCVPVSQRKRVAAPKKQKYPELDTKQEHALKYMFHSKAKSSRGCSLQEWNLPPNNTNAGLQRKRKDGPCVGTKGYRAPEVLFKSLRQNFKVDVWSAGVTLLQLAAAKSPFSSSGTDQAIVDIAKVRGLDEMVNLAKEHERTRNLSQDLFKLDGARPVSLEGWCSEHSRRSDFKNQLPASFFDLLEKCLQINPNKRATAAEALRHEFFAHCRAEFHRKKASIKDSQNFSDGTK